MGLAIQTFKYVTRIAEMTEIKIAIAIPEYQGVGTKAEPGVDESMLVNDMKGKYEVVIGTPGTLVNKKVCDWRGLNIKVMILDEADEFMQSAQFKVQAMKLKKATKPKRIFFLSATFEPAVQKFVEDFMGEPKWTVKRKGEEYHLENLLQFFIVCADETAKKEVLTEIYAHLNEGQSLLFCPKREDCNRIGAILRGDPFNFDVGILHAQLQKQERDEILNDFRRGKVMHLITSNVLARGINIPEISLVMNFTLPRHHETQKVDVATFTHRVGRCTRWDKKGAVVNIIAPSEAEDLKQLQAVHPMKELKLEQCKELENYLHKFRHPDQGSSTKE